VEKNYSRVVTFLVSMFVWVLMTGVDWQNFVAGILVSLLVAFFMGDMFTLSPSKFMDFKRYLWFIWYIFVFGWECIKANIDVAIMVLHPKLPINPGIVKVKTILKTETAITFLANSITLTPGTFVIDLNKEKGFLYVHWLNVRTQDVDEATEIIVRPFEKILKEVFE